MRGQTELARSNTGCDTCVQYALPDQGPEGVGSRSRMAHHLDRARLTSTSPPRGPGKTPLGDEALPVGCHTETIVCIVLGHRLRRLCSVPQEIPYTYSLLASFKREPVYRFSSHIRRTHITVMRRWHSFSSLIPHRHSQTHFQRRCLGHKSFSMHRDRRIYSLPRFQPGIDPFIGHPSRNMKMPVYRAPCISSLIHRDTTTSVTREPTVYVKFLTYQQESLVILFISDLKYYLPYTKKKITSIYEIVFSNSFPKFDVKTPWKQI